MNFLESVKRWLGEITEIALLLIALGVAAEVLFGPSVLFFGGVVTNLAELLKNLGEYGVAGLIALAIVLWLFHRRGAVA